MSEGPRLARGGVVGAARLGLSGLLFAFGVGFAWKRYNEVRSAKVETLETLRTASAVSAGAGETQIRVAGDAWPGYAVFRGDVTLKGALAAGGFGVHYISSEALDLPEARLRALSSGEIDVALVPLASLLQFTAAAAKEPGVVSSLAVQFVVDESSGGEALIVGRDLESLKQLQATPPCVASDGASDVLWRFAVDALPDAFLGVSAAVALSSAAACLEQAGRTPLQLSALRNPYAGLVRSEGYRALLTSRDVAAHLNFDVAVARQDVTPSQRAAIRALAKAYFASVAQWRAAPASAELFLQQDCASLCEKDSSLGRRFLADMKPFDLVDNGCAWFGACAEGGSLRDAVHDLSVLFHSESSVVPDALFDATVLYDLAREAGVSFDAPKASSPGPVQNAAGTGEVSRGRSERAGVLHYEIQPPARSRTDKEGASLRFLGNLKLNRVEFAAGSFQLDAAAQAQIKDWSGALWRLPGVCLRVTGYSTLKEEPEPDYRLSRIRAQAVVRELTRLSPDAFPEPRFQIVAERAAIGVVNARSVEIGVLPCKLW